MSTPSIAVSFLGGSVALWLATGSARRARRAALASLGLLAVVILCVGAWVIVRRGPAAAAPPVAALLEAMVAALVIAALPAAATSGPALALLVGGAAGGAAVLLATDLGGILAGWLVPPVLLALLAGELPPAWPRRPLGYLALSGAAVAAALLGGVILAWRAGHPAPWSLEALSLLRDRRLWWELLQPLLVLGVAVRLGLVPFHGWLAAAAEAPPVAPVALLGLVPGAYVLLELAVSSHDVYLIGVGAVAALLGAVLAVSQSSLGRAVACVGASQAGLMLVGLASHNVVSVTGALAYALAVRIHLTALFVAVAAGEARLGRLEVRRGSGLGRAAPALFALALASAALAAGLPGGLGFVAEDLLLQGVLHVRPWAGALLLVAAALNGIALLRGVLGAMSGPSPRPGGAELLRRERVALTAALALLVATGVAPRLLLSMGRVWVESATVATPERGAPPPR